MSGSNALKITDPNADNLLAQAPLVQSPFFDPRQFGAETESELSPLERWLAQQRAKNNAQGFEPLPGITSGAPPKPWGLDRTQLPQQPQPQPYQSGFIANVLNRFRPMDMTSDPGMATWSDRAGHTFKIPRGGTGYTPPLPDLQRQPTPDIFGSSPYSSEFRNQSWRGSYLDQQT